MTISILHFHDNLNLYWLLFIALLTIILLWSIHTFISNVSLLQAFWRCSPAWWCSRQWTRPPWGRETPGWPSSSCCGLTQGCGTTGSPPSRSTETRWGVNHRTSAHRPRGWGWQLLQVPPWYQDCPDLQAVGWGSPGIWSINHFTPFAELVTPCVCLWMRVFFFFFYEGAGFSFHFQVSSSTHNHRFDCYLFFLF